MDAQRVIARRMVIGLPPDGLTPAWEKDFAQFPPAGVILFAARDFKDLEDARRLIARLRDLARPRRLFVSLDEEGGWVSQLAGHLVVPPNAATLARAADTDTIRWIAGVTARRLHALGFDWDFAPVADVHSQPDSVRQLLLHPSRLSALPSSHCSPASRKPLPHVSTQTLGWPAQA